MSIVPIIALVEEQYKNYLSACKHLCIDPSKNYDQKFIDQKVDSALANEGVDKKDAKRLSSFRKNYKKMEGGVLGNQYISRAKKEISKGNLVLDYAVKE